MTGLYGTSEGPWVVSEYDEHAGYDCMTGGIAVGKHILLDAANYGQGHSWDADQSDFDAARLDADAKALGQVPAMLALVAEVMRGSDNLLDVARNAAMAHGIARELESEA